jgi:hypothetical protein
MGCNTRARPSALTLWTWYAYVVIGPDIANDISGNF